MLKDNRKIIFRKQMQDGTWEIQSFGHKRIVKDKESLYDCIGIKDIRNFNMVFRIVDIPYTEKKESFNGISDESAARCLAWLKEQ